MPFKKKESAKEVKAKEVKEVKAKEAKEVKAKVKAKEVKAKEKKEVETKEVETKEVETKEVETKVGVDDKVEVETDVAKSFVELLKKIQLLSATFVTLKQDFKLLEKQYTKQMKLFEKRGGKKERKNAGPRQPSGFVRPTNISTELALFLGKPGNTLMARTEVTREINKYIRMNNLQDSSNGRKINPDVKLRGLLEVPNEDELTYFNLQKYLSKHFPKAQPVAASV